MTTPRRRRRPAIAVNGLRKSYGDHVVLDGIDLHVAEGSVFALLGPNGAGKTTTVQILSTLIPADGGEARIAGHDVVQEADVVRAAIGVTGQFSAVDSLLTGEENLLLMAELHHLRRAEGRRRAAELLAPFELADAAAKIPATYSGGMRRKARPHDDADGPSARDLPGRTHRRLGSTHPPHHAAGHPQLAKDGVTIFLTTQYLEEADRLADRIALLDRGTLVAQGTADELKRLVPGGHIRLQFAEPAELEAAARAFAVSTCDTDALTLQVPSDGDVRSLRVVLDHLDAASIAVDVLAVHTPDLDDVFLALTGRPADQQTQPNEKEVVR